MTLNTLALTRSLIQMNTVNPPGRERQCAQHLGALLEAAGMQAEYHEFADSRTSLVARLGGSGEGEALCLTGHIDTVPLGAAPWRFDPFAAETDAGRLNGRGASDMKGGIAAMVCAAIERARGPRPNAGLVLVITAGEETGCEGAMDLAQRAGVLGQAGAIVVGEPTGNYPFIGHKGALALKVVTRGVTAHASMPHLGRNAIYAAARAVGRLESFCFNENPHPVMGAPTLNVGTITGGMNLNSVPDRAEIGVDIRTIPGQQPQSVVSQLKSALGSEVSIEDVASIDGVYTEPAHEWIVRVFDIMEPILGERPVPQTASYFTDGAVLAPAYGNPPCVILGPGEPAMAHQTDEYCLIDRLDAATEAYRSLICDWCDR